MSESIKLIDEHVQFNKKNNTSSVLVTPNVDHIVNIHKNPEFKDAYQKSSIILVDGAPLYFSSKLLKKPLKEKVSGADLVPEVLKLAEKRNYKVFIFGSREGVPKLAIDKMKSEKNYSFTIDYYSPPFGFESNPKELSEGIERIKRFRPDILLVSLGSPKGELFIFDNLNKFKVPISMQIGASIDFIAGTVKRAPLWMQKSGLEWFYRFIQEPRRMFKRYFINDSFFLILLIREYLKKDSKNDRL
ncbi:WecB/TagA/CpsF family glycosyltransferase [Bacillus sp. FJAT-50079]|nr:WecB/TagA/CpsF family glycosyltransferase [Bacillus sp. FJAT-50079]